MYLFPLKKALLFSLSCILFLSCKKDSNSTTGNQVVTGILTYSSPAGDGAGLVYTTNSGELLLFNNEIPDTVRPDVYYQDFLDIPTVLTFQDTGELGCTSGMLPCYEQKKIRIVHEIKIEKR